MDKFEKLSEIIRSNKCCICDNVLSVAPIAVIPQVNKIMLRCGRCKEIECENSYQFPFYEDILKCLSFPCIYKNCDKMIMWEEVEEHEKNCEHMAISCPVYYQNCDEVVELNKLEQHFTENHPRNIQHDLFCFDMGQSHNLAGLAVIDNEKFLIYITGDQDIKMLVSVFSLSSSNNTITKFNTTFSESTNDNFSVSYNNQKIFNYNEKVCCFKCFTNKCKAKDHLNSTIYSKRNVIYGLSAELKEHLGRPKRIKFNINFISDKHQIREKKSYLSCEGTSDDEYTKLTGVLRQTVECPICNELMLAPIFSCKTGHVVCNTCRSSLNECPFCKEEITMTRCFVLECMIGNLELPCSNKKYGCSFTGKLDKVREHEDKCELKGDST